jgi:excisionase family DNA binding protein
MLGNDLELDEMMFDISEVSDILKVSPRTVSRLIADGQGELPAIKIGSRWRVRGRDIKEYVLKNNADTAGNATFVDDLINSLIRARNKQIHMSSIIKSQERPNEIGVSLWTQEADLEKQKILLDLERQRLELREKYLEIGKKQIQFSFEAANVLVNLIRPVADLQTKAMLIQALIPDLLQLGSGNELETLISRLQNNEEQNMPHLLQGNTSLEFKILTAPTFQKAQPNWIDVNETEQHIELKNVGKKNAYDICAALFGCETYIVPQTMPQKRMESAEGIHWVDDYSGPLEPGETYAFTLMCRRGKLQGVQKIGEYCLFAPPEPGLYDSWHDLNLSFHSARLTLTYRDVSRHRYTQTFDYDHNKKVWSCLSRPKLIEVDLLDFLKDD